MEGAAPSTTINSGAVVAVTYSSGGGTGLLVTENASDVTLLNGNPPILNNSQK
jgi:hypothetical protein